MTQPLDATLKQINRHTEEQSAQMLASRFGFAYEILDNYPFTLEALSIVPLPVVQAKQYAIYLRTPTKIRVALVHPEDQALHDEINGLATNLNVQVEFVVISPSSLKFLIQSYLKLLQEQEQEKKAQAQAALSEKEHDYLHKIRTLDDLRTEISKVSVTEALDVIIAAAFNQEASDIHLEPSQTELTVRFRIDGVLQKVLSLPITMHTQLISRIKMLAGLHLDEKTKPQDGRFTKAEVGMTADLRVSTIPTGFGEGVVMRILRQDMKGITLSQLGFSQYNQDLIQKVIRKPYGLILVTGPTGSGKSTTLYALLDELNSPEKKIITLEDPIEYRIEGLQQSQVDTERGFSFAEGLRGALRQDPDIVMVGEIRDPETATIALNASLTGHLVLSTLHTNNAVTAHTRFLEMGIAPFLLSGSIQIIIAQRLVRKLVPGTDPNNPQFKGRIVIAEVLTPNQEFEQAVLQKKDQVSLGEIAEKGGMIPMLKDGLEKVKAGLTTESEIYRVTEV